MSSESGRRSRSYRMTARAEAIDSTRQRIVEAAVALHGTIGPAATTISGIADEAGVTRATVYRHFSDDAALFRACSAHWLEQQVPPDPSNWMGRTDPMDRMRVALTDLYRFFRAGESMLQHIYGDKQWLPEEHRRGLDERSAHFTNVLLTAFPAQDRRQPRLPAVIGHAVDFWTWRSLCGEHGLPDADAVELMVDLAAVVVVGSR